MKSSRDPALHVFRHLFASVTDEMGAALQHSAVSPNIKERLDFSCALLDATGRLVAHAAFIPVHLGSAHSTVPALLKELDPGPGDVVILNDPFRGGTHLNDVTVVAPLFDDGKRVGFLLNRAHHADIGGAEPGSMSGASDLFGEGLLIPPLLLRAGGEPVDAVWQMFAANVRDPDAAFGDLQAQLAALHRGEQRFQHLLQRYGQGPVTRAMASLYDHGAAFTRDMLKSWPRKAVVVEDHLDGADSPTIKLRLQIKAGRLVLDFAGSSAQIQGSWNTHRAVTTSAVFYLLQAIGGGHLPETSGTLEAVDLRLPEGSIVGATFPAGVALGNVETSQRVVDVLLAAMRELMPGKFPAASQGTMNNLLFGGTRADGSPFVFYETLAGGAGAGPNGAGASVVQTHMTNTRNTPVEVLEDELPVRVTRLAVRRGSGGKGEHRGGDGLIKEIEFLEPVRLTMAGTRRQSQPASAGDASAGRRGVDHLIVDGKRKSLTPGTAVDVPAGGKIKIATPGGGGYSRD